MPLSKWRHSGCVSGQWKQGGKFESLNTLKIALSL